MKELDVQVVPGNLGGPTVIIRALIKESRRQRSQRQQEQRCRCALTKQEGPSQGMQVASRRWRDMKQILSYSHQK
jgi:hypothetical protein